MAEVGTNPVGTDTDWTQVESATARSDSGGVQVVAAMRKVEAAILQDGPDMIQADPELARDDGDLMQDVSEFGAVAAE